MLADQAVEFIKLRPLPALAEKLVAIPAANAPFLRRAGDRHDALLDDAPLVVKAEGGVPVKYQREEPRPVLKVKEVLPQPAVAQLRRCFRPRRRDALRLR